MSDSEVFVIASARADGPQAVIRQIMEQAAIPPARIEDVVYGLDESMPQLNADGPVQQAGLASRPAVVSSSLRAVFFAAQSILSGDVQTSLVVGVRARACTALWLASPDAVGRWNLLPRARLAARSVSGLEAALRRAELSAAEIAVSREGAYGARLVDETLEELEKQSARWGVVTTGPLVLLIERI